MGITVTKEAKEAKKKEKEEKKKEKEGAKDFDSLCALVEKAYGKRSFRKLGDSEIVKVPAIPTGSMKLDRALGIGGLPRGRIVEIYGPEATGKTTIALHVIAQAQKLGGAAAFIDAEHALDTDYATALGIDVDSLWVSQPGTAEEALDITDWVVKSGLFSIVVIDSVAALVPRAEIEGDMGDSHMGLQARLMSQAMRKLSGSVSKSNTCVIFINQLRMKIGVMFGNPETTSGGNALKFYTSVRLDIRRTGAVKKGEDIIGNAVKIKVAKNKLAAPFKTVDTEIIFGKGFNTEGELVDEALLLGIIEQSGSWYSHGDERIGQGRLTVYDFLRSNPEVSEKIAADIKVERASQ